MFYQITNVKKKRNNNVRVASMGALIKEIKKQGWQIGDCKITELASELVSTKYNSPDGKNTTIINLKIKVMNKIIVKYKHCEKPTVYDVVVSLTYQKGKNEMLLTEARDTVNGIDTRVEWFEVVEERATRGEGDGESKSYESKYERENITLPKEMAKEIVDAATYTYVLLIL